MCKSLLEFCELLYPTVKSKEKGLKVSIQIAKVWSAESFWVDAHIHILLG